MKTVLLGDVCSLITDGKHGDCQNDDNSGYYFISAKDVFDGRIHYDRARQITKQDFEDTHRRTRLDPNDIVITNSGTIGRIARVEKSPETSRTTFQKSVAILKPKKQTVSQDYLYYSLLANVKRLIEQAHGSTQKNLLLGDLRKFKLDISDTKEQQAVVDILSPIDEKIELNRKMNETLEQIGQALFRHYFIDNPEAKEWPQGKFSDLTEVITGKGSTKSLLSEGGKYPLYGAGGLMGTSDKFLIDEPVIITGRVGTLGRIQAVTGKAWYSDNVLIMRPKSGYFGFVYCVVKTIDFISMNRGSSQPLITQTDLKNHSVRMPDKDKVVEYNEKFQPIFNLTQNNEQEALKLVKIRDLLLPRLISGKIKV